MLIFFLLAAIAQGCQLDPMYESFMNRNLQPFSEGITKQQLELAKQLGNCVVSIRNHKLEPNSCRHNTYEYAIPGYEEVAKELPDMDFVVSFSDEPRVLRNNCRPSGISYQETNCYCDPGYKQPRHSHFLQPREWRPIYGKVPLFSPSTIPQCFNDIMFPAHYFFYHPNISKARTPWEERQFKAFWRGGLSEGSLRSANDDFNKCHRYYLLEHCKNISECDLGFTFYGWGRTPEVINFLSKKYPLVPRVPYDVLDQYKILIDIDGVSYSERFPTLLKQGSAVFKISAFTDIGKIPMKPWEHYVPIQMDLSDFDEKLEWAREHDNELKNIAEKGQERSFQVHSRQIYICYLKRLLLRYHQLLEKGKQNLSSSPPNP